jgi:hypothetical protein
VQTKDNRAFLNYSRLRKNRTISASANTNQKASKREFFQRREDTGLFHLQHVNKHPGDSHVVLDAALGLSGRQD